MDFNESLSKSLRELYESKDFYREKLLINFSEKLLEILEDKNLNYQDFAKKLKVSKAYISKIINGKPNLTIKSIADIAFALNLWPEIHLVDRDRYFTRKEFRVVPDDGYFKSSSIGINGEPYEKEFAAAS